MNLPELLTPKEAAAVLRVSEKTLEWWRNQKTGPAFTRLGGRCVRYRKDELSSWLAAQEVTHH